MCLNRSESSCGTANPANTFGGGNDDITWHILTIAISPIRADLRWSVQPLQHIGGLRHTA